MTLYKIIVAVAMFATMAGLTMFFGLPGFLVALVLTIYISRSIERKEEEAERELLEAQRHKELLEAARKK